MNFDDPRSAQTPTASPTAAPPGTPTTAPTLVGPPVTEPDTTEPNTMLEGAPSGTFAAEGPIAGASLFARYAYPPNELGYCGPQDSKAVLEYGAAGIVDRGLVELAKGFAGAWPYLETIAGMAGIADPLDRRVVEAYWLGNDLLERTNMHDFGNSLVDRFKGRAGTTFGFLAEAIPVGAVPHHSFHVFGVYPWVGLLGADRGDTPLHVLQSCRIRWGQVVVVRGEEVDVLSRPLTWDGSKLGFGDPLVETVRGTTGGLGLAPSYTPGDWVSMHWGWVCDRLSRRQLSNLRHYSMAQIDITNHKVAHPGSRAALG